MTMVYSVFCLHELPKKERQDLIREAFRVLKPGGLCVLADSLQTNDEPELNWALERFPKTYHEPFFKSYVSEDLLTMIEKVTGVRAMQDHGFLTKVVWFHRPLNS